jgi:HEAT repeat protein
MDKNQLKSQGLAFGRNFQRAYKTVQLYSPEHPGSQDILQQAYAALTDLLKQNPQFTFGFFNRRVLLNGLLTVDGNLDSLQADFSKRNIAAVTFQLGVTFREFKRCLGLLGTKPEVIDASGGITAFAKKNPVEGLRIIPEERRTMTNEDSVLGMDLESYLVAESIFEAAPGRKSRGLEMLIQAAGLDTPEGFGGSPKEVLDFAGRAAQAALSDPQRNPSDVVQSLARLVEDLSPEYLMSALPQETQERFRGRPSQEIAAELAEDMVVEWAGKRLLESQAGQGAGPGGGSGAGGTGEGVGTGTGAGPGTGTGGGAPGGTGSGTGSASEKEVARILSRTLKTTQMAHRLLQKVGALANQAQLPEEMVERIKGELLWSSLSTEERHARLLAMKEYTESDFRHLAEHVEEVGREGHVDKATAVSERFLDWLDSSFGDVRAAGLSWLPDLLRALSGLQTLAFVRTVAERLSAQLMDETVADWPCHRGVANDLAVAAQCAALFEDFETALKVGLELERSQQRNAAQHDDCCGAALKNLLSPRSVERLVELIMLKQTDVALGRRLAALARMTSAQTAEIVLQLLEQETAATSRSRLIRLAGQLGTSALEAARSRLADSRWYVVRNACNILGTLGDPDLAAQLGPALRHADARVQQAAVAMIAKSQAAGRAEAMAQALPYLQPHLQEAVLDELIVAKDPGTIESLAAFVGQVGGGKQGIREKAAQVLGAISDPKSVEGLSRILYDPGQPLALRRTALNALRGSAVPTAQQRLAEFARRAPADPLAQECLEAAASLKAP